MTEALIGQTVGQGDVHMLESGWLRKDPVSGDAAPDAGRGNMGLDREGCRCIGGFYVWVSIANASACA